MESVLLLARIQFGITLLYHFWFVSLTLGLSILLAIIETQYVLTGNKNYKVITKYWGKLFLINYTVAVVTGLVNEFQFGMNWAEYSRFVGSIFGPPLAFEALTAFFVESIAIGVWFYGWDKVSKRIHLLAIWLVAWAANYSAFWILSANSFMQHPVGFTQQNGRLELSDLLALITNPYLFWQFPHSVLSGIVTAGFFMLAVSSYYLLNKQSIPLFHHSFKLGLFSALVSIVLVIVSGHFYNQYLASVQPMKLAASEAYWQTTDSAPLIIFAVIDESNQKNSYEVVLPGWLSLLTYNSLNTPVSGIKDIQAENIVRFGPGNYIPPVNILFWSFRLMVGIGFFLLFLLAITLWYWWKDVIEVKETLLKIIIASLPLPYVAITTGWIMAEIGRQPWIVYGLLLTSNGSSKPVQALEVWTSLLFYTGIYSLIAAAALYITREAIITGPEN